MKCLICDKEIKDNIEEQVTCKDENHFYSYKNTTGNYEECIGGVIFHSHYADSEEERKLYNVVIELNRKHYEKKVNG